MSFNAGDRWQSLQLNLPDTPVRDLVVKGSDVVLGTHGRGFWILDDTEPLRQLSNETYDAPLTVFESSRAMRGIGNAAVQYFLPAEVDRVTVEIVDGSGEVIRSIEGTKEDEEEGPDPAVRFPPPPPPTVHAGLNRFEWDMRYPGATTFEGMIIWSGRPERGPKAPPGRYRFRVTVGGESAETEIEIVRDPRLKGVTDADLREQFELASEIRDRTSAANEAVIEIRHLQTQLEDRMEGSSIPALRDPVDDVLGRIAAIEEALYQVRNQSSQDPLNFPIKLNNRLASLRRSVESGDARPTDAAYEVFEELSLELDEHLAELDRVVADELPSLNRLLVAENIEPVER